MPHDYLNIIDSPFPPIELPTGETVKAPHPEWVAHREKWRWLLDSYEGGDAYRFASYDLPAQPGVLPASRSSSVPNLVPHKREMEDVEGRAAPNDDYALRLLRTPVPEFVSEAVDKHLGKIYNQPIRRDGPDQLVKWWEDVDGAGSDVDHVMSSSIAPLLMVLGCLDVVVDRPTVPDGETVRTLADEVRLGLDRPVLSYILPQNTPWWKLDVRGGYSEVLVRENGDEGETFVYWNAAEWARYDAKGKKLDGPRGGGDHPYGRVPVFRAFDDPKRPRCRNVAMARYESLAELQREYYNRDSELILSDTTQAHPLVQGPDDYVKADGAIPIGPGWVLPKKKNSSGAGGASYEGWDYLDPPKGAAESIRANKDDIRDAADRAACLTRPAGASGSDVTGQSGVSKRLDQSDGNERLGEIAAVLQRCERRIAEMAAAVMGLDAPDVRVEYPRKFDLFSAGEFMEFAERLTGLVAVVGNLPLVDAALLSRGVRACLPGLDDSEYATFDAEIEAFLKGRADASEEGRRVDANEAERLARESDDTNDDGPDIEEDEDI